MADLISGREVLQLLDSNVYRQARDIVRENATGRVSLIGGAVYRTIAHALYRTPAHDTDFDFLCDGVRYPAFVPPGFRFERNYFDNPRFTPVSNSLLSKRGVVDLIDLSREWSFTHEGFVRGASLNVQAIGLDLLTERLYGPGLRALEERVVRVNDVDLALQRYGGETRLRAGIRQKAAELGFDADLALPPRRSPSVPLDNEPSEDELWDLIR